MSKTYVFKCPLEVYLPRKTMPDRKYLLNLNSFRNGATPVTAQAKQQFYAALKHQLMGIEFSSPISIHFKLWKRSKRKLDRSNIICIVEKFFCDALVHYGCIEDDNDEYIKLTVYETAGIDRDNYRVEAIVRTINT